MIPGTWLGYIGVALGAAALSLFLTPLALRFALRRGVLDEPGGHKGHHEAVPYLGGLAIVTAFAAAVLVAAVVHRPEGGLTELGIVLGLAVALALVGLADDLRGLGAGIRLFAQAGAGVGVWLASVGVSVAGVVAVDAALTVLWIVAVTNAFNLLDNMDGLSAGVAAIAAAWFLVLAGVNGQFLVAALAAALVGVAVGFLRHNFHPARIYMGDAGSLFLGFMLAYVGVKLRFDAPTEVTFFVPVLVLGVAIFDMVLVVTTRFANRRSPLRGGRDHTSHRLVFVGIPVTAAVALIYAAGVAVGWLGLVMSRLDVGTGFLLMGFVLAVAAFAGVLLGRVPVYETSQRRHYMIREVAAHERDPSGPERQPA